jgi:branched-chain amino acid aminotransferase
VYLGQTSPDVGMKLMVSSYTRHHPNAMMTKAKVSGNYVNSFMAKTEAQRNGFDEAVLLDPEGYVAECTGANIFAVRKGELLTPAPKRSSRASRARPSSRWPRTWDSKSRDAAEPRSALRRRRSLCLRNGRRDRRRGDHRQAQDRIGATGPITKKLREAYGNAVRGRHRLSEQWLEYVEAPVAV